MCNEKEMLLQEEIKALKKRLLLTHQALVVSVETSMHLLHGIGLESEHPIKKNSLDLLFFEELSFTRDEFEELLAHPPEGAKALQLPPSEEAGG